AGIQPATHTRQAPIVCGSGNTRTPSDARHHNLWSRAFPYRIGFQNQLYGATLTMRYDDFQFLVCEPQADGVVLVTLNRPEAMNATNDRMHWELTKIWGILDEDPGVKVAVVTGAGDRAFSAGGDLAIVEAMSNSHDTTMRVMKEASDIVYNMLACNKPIVSAINGTAVGAGLAVALLADVSVMAEDARLTDGHARLG